jgi:hypothetical protein
MTEITTAEPATGQSDVVLFGLDENGKPRAARFDREHAVLATKAAGLMSLTVCAVTSPALGEIARQLPAGRIHATGRGFVPNIRRDLYAKLIEASGPTVTGNDQPTVERSEKVPSDVGPKTHGPHTAGPPTPVIAQGYPRDWDDINVGHLVIAYGAEDEGWWEAVVIATEGDMLTLRFRDYPKDPRFVAHRTAVALLKPPPL